MVANRPHDRFCRAGTASSEIDRRDVMTDSTEMLPRVGYYGDSAFNSLLGTMRLCYRRSEIECTVTVIWIWLDASVRTNSQGRAAKYSSALMIGMP
jgi:hypothetical protein